jgi:hypothetical protein
MLGLVVEVEAAVGRAGDWPHEIPQKRVLPGRGDLGSLPGAERMSHKGSVEGFVVEIAHGEHRCLWSVHLQDPLVEVAERLPGNRTVSLRFELTAAAAGPMVAEDGPGPGGRSCGFEIDLNDFSSGVATHHDVKEH